MQQQQHQLAHQQPQPLQQALEETLERRLRQVIAVVDVEGQRRIFEVERRLNALEETMNIIKHWKGDCHKRMDEIYWNSKTVKTDFEHHLQRLEVRLEHQEQLQQQQESEHQQQPQHQPLCGLDYLCAAGWHGYQQQPADDLAEKQQTTQHQQQLQRGSRWHAAGWPEARQRQEACQRPWQAKEQATGQPAVQQQPMDEDLQAEEPVQTEEPVQPEEPVQLEEPVQPAGMHQPEHAENIAKPATLHLQQLQDKQQKPSDGMP